MQATINAFIYSAQPFTEYRSRFPLDKDFLFSKIFLLILIQN